MYIQIAVLSLEKFKSRYLNFPTPALNFAYFHRDKFDELNKGWSRIEQKDKIQNVKTVQRKGVFQNVVFQGWFL